MLRPDCDICRTLDVTRPAVFDARLPALGGCWGYVCQEHFDAYGPGLLGVGHAQRLVK